MNVNNWAGPETEFRADILGRRYPTQPNTWTVMGHQDMPSSVRAMEYIADGRLIRAFVRFREKRVLEAIPVIYIMEGDINQGVLGGIKDFIDHRGKALYDMPRQYAVNSNFGGKIKGYSLFRLERIYTVTDSDGVVFLYYTDVKDKDGNIHSVNHRFFRPCLNIHERWDYLEAQQGIEYERGHTFF